MKNIGLFSCETQGFFKGKLPQSEIDNLKNRGWVREVTGYLRPDVDLMIPNDERIGGAMLVKVDIAEDTPYWYNPIDGSVVLEHGGNPTDLAFLA